MQIMPSDPTSPTPSRAIPGDEISRNARVLQGEVEWFGEVFDSRLARLVPPPHIHRHRYHGVLAPNARLRATNLGGGHTLVDWAEPSSAMGCPFCQGWRSQFRTSASAAGR